MFISTPDKKYFSHADYSSFASVGKVQVMENFDLLDSITNIRAVINC
jgi:hypothetical protein